MYLQFSCSRLERGGFRFSVSTWKIEVYTYIHVRVYEYVAFSLWGRGRTSITKKLLRHKIDVRCFFETKFTLYINIGYRRVIVVGALEMRKSNLRSFQALR